MKLLLTFCFAIDFGVISPNISTNIVITPVATQLHYYQIYLVASIVANDDAPIFTILFPIKIAPKSLFGSSISFSTI